MVSYSKTSIFLLLLFFAFTACEEGSSSAENAESDDTLASYTESSEEELTEPAIPEKADYFAELEYTFEECEGPVTSEVLNTKIERKHNFHLKKDENLIYFFRPLAIDLLNIEVKGSWSKEDHSLSKMKGQFGIGTEENWRKAEGQLIFVGADRIEGNISNLETTFENTSCDVSMRFGGKILL